MTAGAVFVALFLAASPDLFVVPLNPDADEFLVDVDRDGTGDVAVLDGFDLTVYPTANRDAPLTLTLPRDARAMDIVSHPDTGDIAVLAVCGQEIQQFGFVGDARMGRTLFEHHSSLSDGDRPYRNILVFEREGETLFFLPSANAIELRTWSGELRERIEPEEAGGVRRFEAFVGYSESLPLLGTDGSLQFYVSRSSGNQPAFLEKLQGDTPAQVVPGRTMFLGEFDEADFDGSKWPWFALQDGNDESPRVRCTIRTQPMETYIRIDTRYSDKDAGRIGPARKYPGMVTKLNAELPDFNGDGYTDLLLWNTNRPSVSPATIARMALQQDWPIRLTAHLFDPKTSRFTAKPFASLEVRATWDSLLRQEYGSPLSHTVIRDIDADGRTDLAFTVDSQTYVYWMMDERGPHAEEVRMTEPIERVSFIQPLDNTGRVTIGLRTKSSLCVLYPAN